MELVRTRTLERRCERLFYGIGVDTRGSKGERKTKDHLKQDCRMRERQGGVERGEMWSRRRHATEGLDRQCDGPVRLLAQRAVMMMMMMMTMMTLS